MIKLFITPSKAPIASSKLLDSVGLSYMPLHFPVLCAEQIRHLPQSDPSDLGLQNVSTLSGLLLRTGATYFI